MEAWALELENGWAEREREGVGEMVNPYLLIKAANIKRPPLTLKLAYSPRAVQTTWLGYPRLLMRILQ